MKNFICGEIEISANRTNLSQWRSDIRVANIGEEQALRGSREGFFEGELAGKGMMQFVEANFMGGDV